MRKVPDATKVIRVRTLYERAINTFDTFMDPPDLGSTLFYLAGEILRDGRIDLIDGAGGANQELLRWFRECWSEPRSRWIWRYIMVLKERGT